MRTLTANMEIGCKHQAVQLSVIYSLPLAETMQLKPPLTPALSPSDGEREKKVTVRR